MITGYEKCKLAYKDVTCLVERNPQAEMTCQIIKINPYFGRMFGGIQ